jgi:hypothetical protein
MDSHPPSGSASWIRPPPVWIRQPRHELFDSTGAIRVDHPCCHCGYNLRTLTEANVCPECGTPVGLSTRGSFLRFADPEWVDKLALGLKIILWMIPIGILVGILANAMAALAGVLGLAASLVSFYGVWLVTEPEPGVTLAAEQTTARRVVRITLLIGIFGNLVEVIPPLNPMLGGGVALFATVVVVSGLAGLVGEFFKYVYYQQLAERIPDTELAERAKLLRWGFVISLAVGLLAGLFAVLTLQPNAPGSSLALVGCLGIAAGLGLLVFGLLTIFFLLRLRKTVAEQARLARESWVQATGHA